MREPRLIVTGQCTITTMPHLRSQILLYPLRKITLNVPWIAARPDIRAMARQYQQILLFHRWQLPIAIVTSALSRSQSLVFPRTLIAALPWHNKSSSI
jgi:hypothetical protein